MCAKGLRKMYTHTKVDNEAAQALFERAGYVEPAEIKASLTQMQIAQRGTKGGAARQAGAGGGWPHPAGQGTRPGRVLTGPERAWVPFDFVCFDALFN